MGRKKQENTSKNDVIKEDKENVKEKVKDTKKKSNWLKIILKNILTLIVLILMVLAIVVIIKLNVLPNKYLYVIIGIEAFIFLIGLLLYNSKRIFITILGVLFFIGSICLNSALYYYLSVTNNYLVSNFDVPIYKINTEYYLVASSKDSVNSNEELDINSNVYYYKYGKSVGKAKAQLGNRNYLETDNVFEGLNDVRFKNYYFLIPSSRYKFVVEMSNLLSEDQFKVIGVYNIEDTVPIKKDKLDVYNIYINGTDFTGIKRDFNMIISVNTNTRKVVLTSIPRDYYIDVPAYGLKDTLMCMGDLDPEVSKGALENLFDIDIDYIINVNANSLTSVVDALGGIELCSTANDTIGMVPGVYSGCRTYDGEQILEIARYRNNLPGRDRSRQKNMRLIFMIIAKKLASTASLTNYSEVLNSFSGLYTTDISKDTLTQLIKSVIENPNYQVIEQNVDGVDTVGLGHLNQGEAWNMVPDMNTVNAASSQIKSVLNEK